MERRTFFRAGLATAAVAGTGTLSFLASCGTSRASDQRSGSADGRIRLSSNENPLGIPETARQAILEGIDQAHRYPGDVRDQLEAELAAFHGIDRACIVLGNGSTEAIQMAVQSVAQPGTRFITADPTYEDLGRYVEPFGLDPRTVPLTADYAHDLDGMRAAAAGADGPVLVYVCNPNNPTGSLTSSADIAAWISDAPANHLCLVDEAYHHYVADPQYRSLVGLATERPNVVVTRTFSKIYGLAGLRIGYAVTHPTTAERVRAFSANLNTNRLALHAALGCLRDEAFIQQSMRVNEEGRGMLYGTLQDLGLEYIPSHTNFVMFRTGRPIDQFNARMSAQGIRNGRPFPPMLDWSRTSIGLPQEMELFCDVLRGMYERAVA